ncbi:glutathione synthase [Chryseobacterium flavum]|uniref:glutathione synthase n=1 Tax=Chryseobacterium flavum TaxID=415851 RepID=UPI0028AAD18A|nr:glutathione synthase [Chryseobacterium flavum]
MAQQTFKKEDFTKKNDTEYQIMFKVSEIGEGSNLITEKLNENGEYETIQAPIKRFDDSIFIVWDKPFNGRIIFDK